MRKRRTIREVRDARIQQYADVSSRSRFRQQPSDEERGRLDIFRWQARYRRQGRRCQDCRKRAHEHRRLWTASNTVALVCLDCRNTRIRQSDAFQATMADLAAWNKSQQITSVQG